MFKLIFELLFSNFKPNNNSFSSLCTSDFPPEDIKYMKDVYYGVIDKYKELSIVIQKHAQGFNLDRIYKTDLAALLLSSYEMMYLNDIPINVSISEAINLVKVYSTEKSSSYVNGILSSIYKELTSKK
ncbi:MAG: transcription antitermination factor NusB [Clostridiales bacterium]|nr:transcription antitermination factor NusB [Clostridiales bacterium]